MVIIAAASPTYHAIVVNLDEGILQPIARQPEYRGIILARGSPLSVGHFCALISLVRKRAATAGLTCPCTLEPEGARCHSAQVSWLPQSPSWSPSRRPPSH